jgi:hypothetical protein
MLQEDAERSIERGLELMQDAGVDARRAKHASQKRQGVVITVSKSITSTFSLVCFYKLSGFYFPRASLTAATHAIRNVAAIPFKQ